jgi:hypothetical protein
MSSILRGGQRIGFVAVVTAAALLLVACGSGGASGGSTAAPSVPALPSVSAAAPAASAAGASAGSAGPTVAVNPDLLSFVPESVDGLKLAYDPETTARVTDDPALARDAVGLAIAIAVDPGTSAAPELTVVSVVRLRDPSVGDAWFRDYRDSYDQAACASAGGVSGHAETTIDTRQVFIGSCAGGAFIYHVRLASDGIVVSALSVGSRRLGQKVMEGLRP